VLVLLQLARYCRYIYYCNDNLQVVEVLRWKSDRGQFVTERQFQRQLARRLRELRDQAGLSQAEAARRMGVRKQMVQRLENKNLAPSSNPTIRTLMKLARALDVELAELLDFIGAR